MGIIMSGLPDVAKQNFSYSFSDGKPAGMVEDANRTEMLPLVLSGSRLQERSATGGSGDFWWAQAPDLMATHTYRATAMVGNQSSGTDRGACVFVGGTDGAGGDGVTNLVFCRFRGQTNAVVIGTKIGLSSAAVLATRTSGPNYIVAPGDEIGLEISVSGGIYTYQAYKNDVLLSGAVWTDSSNVFGTPGRAWGGGGYGAYSGGYYPSLGLYGMRAADT